MITQREISQVAFREGMSDRVIEKDYVITWILLALSGSELRDSLAFKGGTALKKIYFPDYRYSEDLDFTLLRKIEPDELLSELNSLLARLAKDQGFQFQVPEDRIERRADSLTAYVSFVGPLQAGLGSRDIKVDFTFTEKIIFRTDPKKVQSSYSDVIDGEVLTYSLEEVLTEKLCAIIGRTEPRDIYDADFLFGLGNLDYYRIADAFREKAEFKSIDPTRLTDALERKKPTLQRMWENRLRHQVKDLPHLEEVLRQLNRHVRKWLNP